MKKVQDKFWPMVLSLTLTAMLTGGLLSVVYSLTQEPIEVSKKMNETKSLRAVLPPFDNMKDTVINDTKVTIAYKDSKIAGYAVASDASGYGGIFKIVVGYDKDGVINDYAILEHQETPGLGAKMITWFKDSLPGRSSSEQLSVSKDGGNVDAITAATITSRAFLEAVNKANQTLNSQLQNK